MIAEAGFGGLYADINCMHLPKSAELKGGTPGELFEMG